MALTNKLTAIANAIRAKTGAMAKLTIDEMPTAISNIKTDATEPYVEETYDSSGNIIKVKFVGHTFIRSKAFAGCSTLISVNFPSGLTRIGTSAFSNCINLASASLPSGLTRIEESAFSNCTDLALTSLPSGLTRIGISAFNKCTKLTTITFEGTPSTINSTAFSGCTNLTTINVPWAEGAVANAPWGATNATINYNYTGG